MPSPSPESRARSRSPHGTSVPRNRSRSRSPPRGPKAKKYTGLKWKQASSRDDDRGADSRNNDRGYRDRERDRDDRRRDDRRGRDDRDRDRFDDRRRDRDRHDNSYSANNRRERSPRPAASKPSKPPKPAAAAAPSAPGEQMIIVTVNDRLGTKAQIPCLASDPVKVFKAMVAARIGRPAHEIMLKRQGERPFKDQLTLEDYGVSNGVQIDLELDTGD